MSKVLVIGGGITGCTAAVELARAGHSAVVVESATLPGGKVLSYCCKATDECTRCGVCVAHTAIADAVAAPRVSVLSGASVSSFRNTGKKISAEIEQLYPAMLHGKCKACDACVTVCPAKCITKYQRGGVVLYAIDHSKCLRHKGKRCDRCIKACKSRAIIGDGKSGVSNIVADAMLVAIGHSVYDPTAKPTLGYKRLEGVFTGAEAEQILSTRNYLRKPSESVAFIQCVGSRDPRIGRNYCSSVCCAYASRMARILKHRNPGSEMAVYHIDIQNFDKAFSAVRRSFEEAGVKFVPGVPFSVESGHDGKLRLNIEGSDGKTGSVEHDTVILSVGMGPTAGSERIADLVGLQRDEFGFLSSNIPNVLVAGTCAEPQSISQSMASARAVAEQLISTLPAGVKEKLRKAKAGSSRIPLNPRVLVIGGGIAGSQTAAELVKFGHETVVIEATDKLGGDLLSWNTKFADLDSLLAGAKVLRQAKIEKLNGNLGAFEAQVRTSGGIEKIECGAVVVCTGKENSAFAVSKLALDNVMDIRELSGTMARLPNKERPRSVAIILDGNIEETKASSEMAFRIALDLRKKYRCEVSLFCREVRVAAKHLEQFYDDVREAGVGIVKYSGEISIASDEDDLVVTARDTGLGKEASMSCGIAGMSSYGMAAAADKGLANLLGINSDPLGQLQDNNLHLFPEMTNRPGLFVVGACSGRFYVPEIVADAQSAALRVHALLSQRFVVADGLNAAVDATKCALCLTCVRSCPHGAMIVDAEKRAAMSLPEVCQKCGICAGECPAQAIELPLGTER